MARLRDALAALRGAENAPVFIEYDSTVSSILGMSIDELWRTQPYLRTVVTFLARNIAQLGLHVYRRVSDTDRERVHYEDDPIVRLLAKPNSWMTTYDLVFGIVGDKALYDEAFLLLYETPDTPSGWTLEPLSPSWVTRRGGNDLFRPEWIEFARPNRTGPPIQIPVEDLIHFRGWNPGHPRRAASPVEALKQILAEQISAQVFREQMWKRGGRIGGILTRPPGAGWSTEAREKFQRQWQARYSSNSGALAGGTPILEDGMTYEPVQFNAHEAEFVEASKLALSTVASVFHVNPTMVGLLDNANFSNVKEFRSMLYGDTLGSTIAELEDVLDSFLIPRVSTETNFYSEFNIAEKLQGSFDEQAAALSSSVGRPWMTANEARARLNLPALDGDADSLVTPLNVVVGGQASPRDSAPKQLAAAPLDLGKIRALAAKASKRSLKADEVETGPYVAKTEEVLAAFFERQSRTVLSRLGGETAAIPGAAKATPTWWDEERWDRELTRELKAVSVLTATDLGREEAVRLGFVADDYDADRTFAFLEAVAVSRAGAINAATLAQLEEALADDEEAGDVFDYAIAQRTGSASSALVACLAGFALVEAGKQLLGSRAEKTWITGPNPRADHAAMDGETVSIEETFSNGAEWPGDPVLGVDGVAGCNCGVSISY